MTPRTYINDVEKKVLGVVSVKPLAPAKREPIKTLLIPIFNDGSKICQIDGC